MAVIFLAGFESGQLEVEGMSPLGSAAISTTQARTGTRSVRCNPASGVEARVSITPSNYWGFGLYIAALPSITRQITGGTAAANHLQLTSGGVIEYHDGTSVVGSSGALNTGQWYWISFVGGVSISGDLLAVDGVAQVNGTSGASSTNGTLGFGLTEASTADVYFDDVITDSAALPTPTKVVLLLPVSDNSNTNWRTGNSGTTNLFAAIDNVPPAGVVSASETATSNVESASSTGTANYSANLATYSSAGIVTGDTIDAVLLMVQHGEDIGTGTKTGTTELTSNPTLGAVAFTAGDNVGAHGATPSSWSTERRIVASPSVTLGSNVVAKLVKTDTTTRVLCVDFVGLQVAYRPAAVARTPALLIPRQAVQRAASW